MPESATDAALRAIQPTINKIRGCPCPADQIPPHTSVKVGGEWASFDGFQESTGLMFLSTGSSGFTYRPTEGEVFMWAGRF